MKVSLFASAVRPGLWDEFLKSVVNSKHEVEVVFAGPTASDVVKPFEDRYPFFRHIHTEDIKPAQAYEVALRACTGDLVQWTADDAEYRGPIIDESAEYWQSRKERKLLFSLHTMENGSLLDMRGHSFFGNDPSTPLMAPLGLMSREYLMELGGIDQRYISGQYENDIAMRVMADGGSVEIFSRPGCFVQLEHSKKHGPSTRFWTSYDHDRKILEGSWSRGKTVSMTRFDTFEPFPQGDITKESFGPKGIWK